jgi:hypothetical protein
MPDFAILLGDLLVGHAYRNEDGALEVHIDAFSTVLHGEDAEVEGGGPLRVTFTVRAEPNSDGEED